MVYGARNRTSAGETGRDAIVFAAADCFMQAGYDATSIDDVAARLNATKGRVYHYYRSKADLFFDVQRRGMEINLATLEPIALGPGDPLARLTAMCRSHLSVMMEYLNFQRVVMQGVEMHLAGATTPAQRRELARLMAERERYEGLFRKVLVEGRQAGLFAFANPSFASKAVLAVLNNPVLWFRRRDGDDAASRQAIIDEFTAFALNCVRAA
ncbi:MAG: TetR family transcriptional regulator [Alphaproteobacteria bacterium]|nr:MAG: TetR family transcriptional regulator [Alphaproteobacteria bacterium]